MNQSADKPPRFRLKESRATLWRRKLNLTPFGTVLSVFDTARGRRMRPQVRLRLMGLALLIAALIWLLYAGGWR